MFFRRVARHGHYAGREGPNSSRQGIYAFAPDGTFLASGNPTRAPAARRLLGRALARWATLPATSRRAPEPLLAALRAVRRDRGRYPVGGLALSSHVRDLTPPPAGAPDVAARAWNRDVLWLTRAEARAFVPAQIRTGARQAVPRALVLRLVRTNLVDVVRGQTDPWRTEDVRVAELTSEVIAVDDGRATLRLRGRALAVQTGRWPIDGVRDAAAPAEQERGYGPTLLGRATWDVRAERFIAFTLIAAGPRWGATGHNVRTTDPGPRPMAVVLTLAPPALRVAPAYLWLYEWPERPGGS